MCVHAHVREQKLENRCTVTFTDGIKEPGLLLRPWTMRLNEIGHEKLVEKQRKGPDLDDGNDNNDTTVMVVVMKGNNHVNDNDDNGDDDGGGGDNERRQ